MATGFDDAPAAAGRAAANQLTTQRAHTGIAAQAPSFMDQDAQMGLDLVREKIKPPFLKIVQKQSDDAVLEQYGRKAVLLVPDMIQVLEPDGAPVRIVPLFFFTEFLKLNPISLRGMESMIVDRTTNPASDLARKCAVRDLWFEEHPQHPRGTPDWEDYQRRNCEALSFVCVFQEEHLPEIPFTMSFSKGSIAKGGQFCNLVSMRKRPIFGCVFEMDVDPVPGKNAKGSWEWLRLQNPREKPFVEDRDKYEEYKAMHLSLFKGYQKGLLEAGYDEGELVGEVVTGSHVTSGVGDTGGY